MRSCKPLHQLVLGLLLLHSPSSQASLEVHAGRETLSINDDWKFWRSETNPDGIIYDWRPDSKNLTSVEVLKEYILPSANDFISDPANHHRRPQRNLSSNIAWLRDDFDDSGWDNVTLPHDWAIYGPFYTAEEGLNPVNGGMGRLPVQGVGIYRRKLNHDARDSGKTIYLDVEGAMSYAMVWLNGDLVGGWPYGYNSFRLDLTPFLRPGDENTLAIRLDNPLDSARWYPGGGLYRNVWLTKVNPIHVAQYGTFITTRNIRPGSATLDLEVRVESKSESSHKIEIESAVHEYDHLSGKAGKQVLSFPAASFEATLGTTTIHCSTILAEPRLWAPLPNKQPALYVVIVRLYQRSTIIDNHETTFGIRIVDYTADRGLLINSEPVKVQGVNQHHDLGALGAAFNVRAAERQLEVLRDLGCNAIRMSHNPPAPQLLEFTDRMGFLVMDEIFDTWEFNKTEGDFHLIFPDWHEPDLRSFIRRDRNHPSVISWSYGNEVHEQYTNETGAALSARLREIVRQEDPTRLSTASMNYAMPNMSFPGVLEIISLNYQGAGIRDIDGYIANGIVRPPSYPWYHSEFPDKMIWSTETASTLSSRGIYTFPVTEAISAPANRSTGQGTDNTTAQVSAYELYTAGFGSSPDKVFASQDQNPFVAGEFVWTGWDYIGEPTPFYSARSSYSGIIDLAGFRKDRFWLYQSRWRPDLRFAHILPHWTWPDRVGEVTPVHVFTSADEAELFVNGKSQGRKRRGNSEDRFRWNEVVYQPGEVQVATWKEGRWWANDSVRSVGEAVTLRMSTDRTMINGDGLDLAFLIVEIVDGLGDVVPGAANEITFAVERGPGEMVASDNGDPTDFTPFPSPKRKAFNGLALGIVRGLAGSRGAVVVSASAQGLRGASVELSLI